MANGLFSVLYGQRGGKTAPSLGRPGTMEESLGGYTGLRHQGITYITGANVTATGIVNVENVGAGTTLPLNLNRVNDTSGADRTRLSVPMALVWQYASSAATGVRDVTFRVSGTDQFDQPVYEDVRVIQDPSVTSAVTSMTRIFASISAVQVMRRENVPSSGDTLTVDFQVNSNPKFGLPLRVSGSTDVKSVVVFQPGVLMVDIGQFTGTSFTVDTVHHAVTVVGAGALLTDVNLCLVHINMVTSLGMTLGNNRTAGQKYFYIR